MSQDDTLALTLDRNLARSFLAGECLPRRLWTQVQENANVPQVELSESDVLLILKRDSLEDGQAIANALVLGIGVLPRAMVIDADAPVPEGFEHKHFVEVGEPPHFRNERGQMVHEVIPPVKFCD